VDAAGFKDYTSFKHLSLTAADGTSGLLHARVPGFILVLTPRGDWELETPVYPPASTAVSHARFSS